MFAIDNQIHSLTCSLNDSATLWDLVSCFYEASLLHEKIPQDSSDLTDKICEVALKIFQIRQKNYPQVTKEEFERLIRLHEDISMTTSEKNLLTEEDQTRLEALIETHFPSSVSISMATAQLVADYWQKIFTYAA